MRWFILFVGLMISFPSLAIANEEWEWIMICEVFSEPHRTNVEVYRKQFDEKPIIYGSAVILTEGSSGFGSADIYYIEWGMRSCKIMTREIYESQER